MAKSSIPLYPPYSSAYNRIAKRLEMVVKALGFKGKELTIKGLRATYGISCNNDWIEDECNEFNQQQVNGGDWTFSSEPCEERGFKKYFNANDTYIINLSNCP